MASLTLLEAAKRAMDRGETYRATLMELYAKSSDLLRGLPIDSIQGNAVRFNREKVLPTPEFRGVNETYTGGVGQVDEVIDSLAIAGGEIKVDVFLEKTMGPNQRTTQEEMQIKSLSLACTKKIIKGDVTSDKKEFDGIQAKIDELESSQIISNSTTASGAGLSLAKLDELIDAVENPTHLVMNKALRRRLTQAARAYDVGGYITYSKDEFGRPVTQYNDLPILIVGKDETNTEILAFSEAAYTGSSVCSSIYCLSADLAGTCLIQNDDLSVRDLGEMQTEPKYLTRVEWYLGVSIRGPLSAARLRYIADSTATT